MPQALTRKPATETTHSEQSAEDVETSPAIKAGETRDCRGCNGVYGSESRLPRRVNKLFAASPPALYRPFLLEFSVHLPPPVRLCLSVRMGNCNWLKFRRSLCNKPIGLEDAGVAWCFFQEF
jgi:hypothetical protein